MYSQHEIHFKQIAEAIEYFRLSSKNQPGLFDKTDNTQINPAHFQQLFSQWAGISPEKFFRYISIGHAKKVLRENKKATLANSANDSGFLSTSRLHNLFISIEGMTPAEYKAGGEILVISYNFFETPFGKLIVASTEKGICHMAFEDDPDTAIDILKGRFPQASYQLQTTPVLHEAARVLHHDSANSTHIKLHVKGTGFQLKVWESLLKIPIGKLTTYGSIATDIGCAAASRAVGAAIGSNPVAYLIPCHRVIQSSGIFGGYMWGETRKAAMIGWEQAHIHH